MVAYPRVAFQPKSFDDRYLIADDGKALKLAAHRVKDAKYCQGAEPELDEPDDYCKPGWRDSVTVADAPNGTCPADLDNRCENYADNRPSYPTDGKYDALVHMEFYEGRRLVQTHNNRNKEQDVYV